MAAQSKSKIPVSDTGSIDDLCRGCRRSLRGQQIYEVTEWCCLCISQLVKDPSHRCEHNFASKRSKCELCISRNTGTACPCVGPPTEHAQLVTDFIAAAKKVDKLEQDKKLASSEAQVHDYDQQLTSIIPQYKALSASWQEVAKEFSASGKSISEGVRGMARARKEEDAARGMDEKNKIFTKYEPESVATNNPQPEASAGVQTIDLDGLLDEVDNALGKVDKSFQDLMQALSSPDAQHLPVDKLCGHMVNYTMAFDKFKRDTINTIARIQPQEH